MHMNKAASRQQPGDQLAAMYRGGMSCAAIAKQIGRSRSAVYERLVRMGVSRRPKCGPHWSHAAMSEAVELHKYLSYRIWPRGDCWEWRGSRRADGYGIVTLLKTSHRVHRLTYEIAKGSIPVGLEIDHLCRHRWCVRPSHLEVVTHHENALRGDRHTKIFCPRGHRFTPETTYVKSTTGHRECRICIQLRNRARCR